MNQDKRQVVIAIVGPTAVGKTSLAMKLALRVNGEIVSADSRQVYKHMDIGTAKPSQAERELVPHHLIDIRLPDEGMTLADFQSLAYGAISEIHATGKLPLLVGGTGQYVRAVAEGWRIPHVPPNEVLRRELENRADAMGHEALHDELASVDLYAARAIDSRNVRRVIRALEVYYVTGTPISTLQGRQQPPFDVIYFGLTRPRPILYEQIDRRIGAMVEAGLVNEVRHLVDLGYDWSLPAMSSLGYKQFRTLLEGNTTLDDAVALVKHDTRTFVRMQYNWFKLQDSKFNWIDLNEIAEELAADKIVAMVSRWRDA